MVVVVVDLLAGTIGLGHVKVGITANPGITVKKSAEVDISLNLILTSAVRQAHGTILGNGDHATVNTEIQFETITLRILALDLEEVT